MDIQKKVQDNNQGESCPQKFNFFCYMIKVDRIAAWTLLFVVIAYGVTGYGMTKGLINPNFSRSLHFGLLGIVGLLAFAIHTIWAIHLFLKRNKIWNNLSKTILFGAYLLLVLFFIYVQFFFNSISKNNTKNYSANNYSAGVVDSYSSSSSSSSTNHNTKTTVYTAETLRPYNGLNGMPAYVAVDGLVYDFTAVFKNGNHFGYSAGLELSDAFHAQHSIDILKKFKIVGSYQAQ